MTEPIILIVDDAAFMRNVIGNTLKQIGYKELYFAANGFQAVDKAKELKPDFITLDISMPGIDGIEVIGKLLEVSPESKIIMISAVTAQQAVKQAIKNGAVDFIAKPFSKEEIAEVLKRHTR